MIKGGMLRSGSWTTYKWGNDPLLIDGSVQSVLMGADTTVEFFEDGMFESDSYAVRNFQDDKECINVGNTLAFMSNGNKALGKIGARAAWVYLNYFLDAQPDSWKIV